jgi:8-oxo-dGTP diphosphatase
MLDALVNAGFRLAYWLGYRTLRCWWLLRRPEHRGALVAVWREGRILMLRQSYRPGLEFPGGGLLRGEAPRAAACRELAEEVGLAVVPEALTLAREMTALCDGRIDHVSIFELRLGADPALRPDRREIVGARFMAPAAALAAEISPFARAYLEAERVA